MQNSKTVRCAKQIGWATKGIYTTIPQNAPMTDSISRYGGFGNRAVTVWQGYGYIETLIRQVWISQMDTHTCT